NFLSRMAPQQSEPREKLTGACGPPRELPWAIQFRLLGLKDKCAFSGALKGRHSIVQGSALGGPQAPQIRCLTGWREKKIWMRSLCGEPFRAAWSWRIVLAGAVLGGVLLGGLVYHKAVRLRQGDQDVFFLAGWSVRQGGGNLYEATEGHGWHYH